MLWIILFRTFGENKIQNILLVLGHVTSESAVVDPPIKLSPSFQYVNFKNYTSTEPIFGKINNIHRYADKKLAGKK